MGTDGPEHQGQKPTSLSFEDVQEARKGDFWKAHQITFDQLMAITEVDEAERIEPGDNGNHSNGNSEETQQNANN